LSTNNILTQNYLNQQITYVYDFAVAGPTIMYDIILDTIVCCAETIAKNYISDSSTAASAVLTATTLFQYGQYIQKRSITMVLL
jgi:hypothetical protein